METGIKRHLLNLEREYWQAFQARDAETVSRLTDESCLVAGAHGTARLEPSALAEMVRRADYTLDDFQVKDGAEVRLINDDVAIITYKVHETLTVDGEQVSLDAADASTWVRRDGRWRCALHTESLAGDPFGRDKRAPATRH